MAGTGGGGVGGGPSEHDWLYWLHELPVRRRCSVNKQLLSDDAMQQRTASEWKGGGGGGTDGMPLRDLAAGVAEGQFSRGEVGQHSGQPGR